MDEKRHSQLGHAGLPDVADEVAIVSSVALSRLLSSSSSPFLSVSDASSQRFPVSETLLALLGPI